MSNSKQVEDKHKKEKDEKTASSDDSSVEANDEDTNHLSLEDDSDEGSDKGRNEETKDDESSKEMSEKEEEEEEEEEEKEKDDESESVRTERKTKSKVTVKGKKSTKVNTESPVGENSSLPDGWTKTIVQRKSGKTAGRFDVYIFNPEGRKFRSKIELVRYLRSSKYKLKADLFSFDVDEKNDDKSSKSSPGNKKRFGKRKASPSPPPSSPSPKKKKNESTRNSRAKTVRGNKKLQVNLPLISPKKMLSDYAQQSRSKYTRKSSQDLNQSKNSKSPTKERRSLKGGRKSGSR